MILQGGSSPVFTFPGQLPIVVEASAGPLSPDGGLLVFHAMDEQLGMTRTFAAAINDTRDPDLIDHTVLEMVRVRVYGILADYEDQNDVDTIGADPIFKIIAGRAADGPDLPSQPTLSRFENSVDIASLKNLRDVFIDEFIASFTHPPRSLTFDFDAVDDPAHGKQQLTCWHNYYDQNQYYPLVVTCSDNDQIVMLSLRHGSAHATLGADSDLEYLVTRLRRVWPDVVITIRADAAFGVPLMMDLCEQLNLLYVFGLTGNLVLFRQTEDLLQQAVLAWQQERHQARNEERTPQPSRLFTTFTYQARTWLQPRRVVAKAEANEQGTNRRFVVTNRPGAALLPAACYDEYVERGESENRNKELKCGCHGGRLSDHRFLANYFRLYLHGLALNLLVRLRRAVAIPTAPAVSTDQQPEPGTGEQPAGALLEQLSEEDSVPAVEVEPVPVSALAGEERQRHFRQRRQRDVLGEGQPDTWRRRVIKMAVEVVVSRRRIVLRLWPGWPHLAEWQGLCQRLAQWLAEVSPAAS